MQPWPDRDVVLHRVIAWAALTLLTVWVGAVSGCRMASPAGRGGPSTGAAFRFENRQAQSGMTFRHHPTPDSAERFSINHYDHGNGILAADIDGDGLADLYFPNQMGRNSLYKNLGHGTFQDVTTRSGTGVADRISVGGAFADIDNDGNADLFVTMVRGGNVLFRNNGDGTFTDITKDSGLEYDGHSSGAVFFDFDRDGLLDLLVVNVGRYTTDQFDPRGYYIGRDQAFRLYQQPSFGERSRLYKNLGGGRFLDVTDPMGLNVPGWHGDAAITDYNDDDFPDLYLCNMNGDDQLLENVGGRLFKDVTRDVFPTTSWGTMGVKFFDFDNDLLLDLMTTDMHSDMLLDVKEHERERKVQASRVLPGMGDLRRNILGNAFYHQLGARRYEEISDRIGAETYWPWGVSVEDLDADGYQDAFVSSGMGYPYAYGQNYLLMNARGTRFERRETALGIEPRADGPVMPDYFRINCDGADHARRECQPGFNDGPLCRINGVCYRHGAVSGARSSRSSVIVDVDNDGDLDIVTNEFNGPPQLLISDLAQRRAIRYLKIRLIGTRSNRDAIGARVTIFYGDRHQLRYVDGKSGYLSQSRLPLYFGLGDADRVDRIEVLWPSGQRQSITDGIGIDRLLSITEPP
jgi:hypothetical protein